jgi:hypothetical protein
VTSAGAALMMRSPMSVWRRTNSHSFSSSEVGLERISSGIATLPTVVQLGGVAGLLDLVLGQREPLGRGLRELGHVVEVGGELRVALREGGQQDVLALPARRRRASHVLLRVHPLVGDAQGRGRVGRLERQQDRAVRAPDGEAPPRAREGAGRPLDDRLDDLIARLEQGAELVAAHPERLAAPGEVPAQIGAEPDQQGVPGGWPKVSL